MLNFRFCPELADVAEWPLAFPVAPCNFGSSGRHNTANRKERVVNVEHFLCSLGGRLEEIDGSRPRSYLVELCFLLDKYRNNVRVLPPLMASQKQFALPPASAKKNPSMARLRRALISGVFPLAVGHEFLPTAWTFQMFWESNRWLLGL